MRRLARAEDGFTLIEVLLAVTLMAVGIGATLNVYNGSSRSALAAQRVAVASHQAQKELDRPWVAGWPRRQTANGRHRRPGAD